MQLAAYLCVCVCVFMVILCLACCPFRLYVCCHLLVCPRTSHFTTPPDCISSKPNRTDPIQSDPPQLSSAQLTVNSNAIIYTIHLHCPADRL